MRSTREADQAVQALRARGLSPHEIVQKEKSTLGSWLHGIVHILEGDRENAQGWYRRAERAFPGMDAAQSEIAAARAEIEKG
jgi:hypothetical protein